MSHKEPFYADVYINSLTPCQIAKSLFIIKFYYVGFSLSSEKSDKIFCLSGVYQGGYPFLSRRKVQFYLYWFIGLSEILI